MTASNDDVKNISVIIQSQLMQYGINVKLDPRDNTALSQAKADYTAWDMQIGEQGSRGLVASILAGQAFNASEASATAYGGLSANFIDDEYLDEISEEIMNVNTYNEEAVERQWLYLIEKCYVVGLQCNYTNYIVPWYVTGICKDSSNSLRIAACTFQDPNA
jgi:ABC-type transport system substrate-binding protein